MGKMMVLLIGLLATIVGIAEIVWKWEAVKIVFWGLLGIMLLAAGVLALAIGISEISSGKKE